MDTACRRQRCEQWLISAWAAGLPTGFAASRRVHRNSLRMINRRVEECWRLFTLPCASQLCTLLTRGSHGMAGQSFSQRPDSTGNAMTIGDDRIECVQDPVAIGAGDDEGW